MCSDCGLITMDGPAISDLPAFGGYPMQPERKFSRSSPLKRLREWHPACERTAERLASALPESYERGMSKPERMRHTQALAYLAYRDDGQTGVTISSLAAQVRVPEERLSKDVKRLSTALGVRGWSVPEDDCDVSAFSRAILGRLKPGHLKRGCSVRGVHRWCRDVFRSAVGSGEVELANAAPKHQADAALAAYCRVVGTPFVEGSFGDPKPSKRGVAESDGERAIRVLTSNTIARRMLPVLIRFSAR